MNRIDMQEHRFERMFSYVLLGILSWRGTDAACMTSNLKMNEEKDRRPNVIYIFPDQMRNHAMGFWQNTPFKEYLTTKGDPVFTPNLNGMAQESMVLTSVFSTCPLSSPYRGTLMTGMYPSESGVPINCFANRPIASIREDVTYLSDVFSEAGYNCAYMGKTHVDYLGKDEAGPKSTQKPITKWNDFVSAGNRHGFDYWYVLVGGNRHKHPCYWDSDGIFHEVQEWSPIHEAKKAISYLRNENGVRDSNKPFFLMLSMNPPHSPYQSLNDCMEEDYILYKDKPIEKLLVRPNVNLEMKKTRCAPYYFASVTGIDRALGMILNELNRLGLEENTIVVFTSDHGETMCSQGISEPKNSPYLESVNVPFLVRYPGKVVPKVDNELLLATPDIMPTLLGLCGLADEIPETVMGDNYARYFLGEVTEKLPEGVLYIKNVNGYVSTDGKVRSYIPIVRGVKTKRYTMALTIDSESWTLKDFMLFDDWNDPYQQQELSLSENEAIVKQLCSLLASLLKKASDPWYEKKILADMLPYE